MVEFSNAGADLVLTKPLKQATLDQLLIFFEENGVRTTKSAENSLILDGEKLCWIPKKLKRTSSKQQVL